jgi:hypothetical protein
MVAELLLLEEMLDDEKVKGYFMMASAPRRSTYI